MVNYDVIKCCHSSGSRHKRNERESVPLRALCVCQHQQLLLVVRVYMCVLLNGNYKSFASDDGKLCACVTVAPLVRFMLA